MIDKRFPPFYLVIVSFFIGVMTVLMILLYIEYSFFCRQTNELLALKQQYSCYIEMFDRKINGDDNNLLMQGPHFISTFAGASPGSPCETELSMGLNKEWDYKEAIVEENFLYNSDEIPEGMIEGSSLIMDEIIAAESSDAPDNDDEYVDDSFVIINRHPDYLKQSTLDYMESQEMNALMTAIDIDRWSDYTESFNTPVHKTPERNKAGIKKESQRLVSKVTDNTQQKEVKKSSAIRRPIKDCGFMWPIEMDKFWISSLFGPRKRIDGTWGFHHGVDMAAVKGTAVRAVRAGTVVEASFQTGYGNTVVVKHSEILKTRYAHLNAIRAFVGQKVKQSAIIGTVGETGFIRKKGKDGSHLHFEVYEYGKRVNPLHCLPRMT